MIPPDESDDDFGDDFDDFEEGAEAGGDDDFADFDDGFEESAVTGKAESEDRDLEPESLPPSFVSSRPGDVHDASPWLHLYSYNAHAHMTSASYRLSIALVHISPFSCHANPSRYHVSLNNSRSNSLITRA